MPFDILPKSEIARVGRSVRWTENQQSGSGPGPRPDQRQAMSIRGYLLQNIFGNGSGLMLPVARIPLANATEIRIVGTNYVADSQFYLQLWGTPLQTTTQAAMNPPVVPVPQMIFQTKALAVDSTALVVQASILLAAQTAGQTQNFPVKPSDFTVTLGNPVSFPNFVLLSDPTLQPELVPATQQDTTAAEAAVATDQTAVTAAQTTVDNAQANLNSANATVATDLTAVATAQAAVTAAQTAVDDAAPDELEAAEEDLEEAQSILSQAQGTLIIDQAAATAAQIALTQAQTILAAAQAQLLSDQAVLAALQAQLTSSYAGIWIIQMSGVLAKQYSSLNFQVFQDANVYLRGLSTMVTQPTKDLVGDKPQIVSDIHNRPIDYPWAVGSMVACMFFLDIGYGIVSSDFRSQTISLPTSAS